MHRKHKKVSAGLNYNENLLILALWLLDVFQFLFLFRYLLISEITNSVVRLKVFALSAGIKKYKPIVIKKKKKKHKKVV